MQIILDLYKDYGYGVIERATPSSDGLFPVERRILAAVNKLAKDKFVKSAKVVGEAFGLWHPHSPESIYQTMAKLVRRGLIQGQGNFGKVAMVDAPPAAMRYTEVKAVPWLQELAFKLVKFVPWKEIEGTEAEPTVLPSPIPLLIGSGLAEGISYFKYCSLLFDVSELLKALRGILTNKEYIPKPKFHGCKYSGDLEKFWNAGSTTLNVEPKTVESNDYLDIRGKLQKIDAKKWESVNISYSDLSAKGEIRIRLYKRRGIDLKKYIPKWKVNTSLLMYVNGQLYTNIGLKHMLEFQYYNVFLPALQASLEEEKVKLESEIKNLQLIKQIKNIITKHPRIKEDGLLQKFPQQDRRLVQTILGKYPIRSLMRITDDTAEIQKQLKIVNNRLSNIEKYGLTLIDNMIEMVNKQQV